ncbi:URB2-like protein, partial [Mya arenaria]
VYVQLRDKSLSVPPRLKLLRYAWQSSLVYIPNKHQVLIDLLFGFLINKKKDHSRSYDVYLRAQQGSRDGAEASHVHKKARPIEQLYETFTTFIKNESRDRHDGNHFTAHCMMVELCHLIGLCAGEMSPGAVRGGNLLLGVVTDMELYTLVGEETTNTAQLQFFRQMVDILLECPDSQSFGEVIQALPQTVMLELWTMLTDHLSELPHGGHFPGACAMYNLFLLNVKVADYTVTDMTLTSVYDHIVILETRILSPILGEILKSEDMLTVQRVRALLLHLGTTDWSVVTDIISSMVSFSEAFTLGSRQCTWTGTLWQVTGDNLDLACWDLLLGNLVAMETVLSQEQRRKVAEHIVQALLNKAEHTECNYKTPKSVTQAVLDSGVFFETGELLTEIVTQLWKHGTGTLTHSSPKNESLLRLQESAGHLQQLMSDTGQSLPDMDWTPWINIGQGEESVCKLYLELGTRMLSSCGRLPIFQLLHVPTFLTWMLELVNNTAQLWNRPYLNDSLKSACEEMYVLMARPVLKLASSVKDCTYSHHESLLENGNVHGRLAALWFLQTSARYHTLHASVLTMETKLALWQHLVQVVRQALNTQTPDKQPPLCIENSSEHSSSLKKTDATEYGTGHLRDSRKSRKRKHTSVSEENEMDTSSSKDNGTSDIINQVRAILQCKDDITGSEARDIGICTEPDKLATSEAIEPLDFRILVYKGHLLENGDLLVLQQTQTVMAAILVALNIDQFQDVLRQLEHDMHPSTLQSDRGKVSSSLFIWRSLLKLEFTQEQTKVVRKVAKDLMLNWQCIVERLQGWDDRSVCHGDHSASSSGTATIAASGQGLLLSVVEHSDQDQVSGKPDVIDSLLACAYQMERLFSLIATHKLEFGKLAVYVVADYVTAVQKVTLLPAIKRGVVPAVYRMLDLCDRHAIPQLHVVLPHGLTEIFKLLYADYTKYHKYTGRV